MGLLQTFLIDTSVDVHILDYPPLVNRRSTLELFKNKQTKNKQQRKGSMCICDERGLPNWFQPKHFFTWTWNSAWICYGSARNHFLQLSMCLVYTPTAHSHTNMQNIEYNHTEIEKLFIATNFLFYPFMSLPRFCIVVMCLTNLCIIWTPVTIKSCNCLCEQHKLIFGFEREYTVLDINIKYLNTFNTWWHSSCTMTMVTSSRYDIEEMLGSSSILCSTKTLSPQFSIAAYGCLGTANRSRNRKNIC